MFDPSKLAETRAIAAAQRRVAEWAGTYLQPLAPRLPDPFARLSVREVSCTDPACATPEGVEVLVTLTSEEWSVTTKILKSARSCEVADVHAAIDELVEGARPRAVAALARRRVEQSAPGDLSVTPGSSSSSKVVPMAAETFAVRVLTRVSADFPSAGDRRAALRVLKAALRIELEHDGMPVSSKTTLNVTSSAASSSTVGMVSPTVDAGIAASADSANNREVLRPPRVMPMPDLSMSGRSKLREADGDEASEMNRHAGGRSGGISCPCCNPDDPQFLVDRC